MHLLIDHNIIIIYVHCSVDMSQYFVNGIDINMCILRNIICNLNT